MLLTENIAVRYREWRDRETEEPDLVPRLRRLWAAPRGEAPETLLHRRPEVALRREPALEAPRGA